jgi:hypothetical protein
MAVQPMLLVLDDGELSDIASLLNEMGVEYAHLRGSAIPPQIPPPQRVIVTTPRRAMLTKDWPRSAPYRIAVVTEDSNTLRAMLRRVGFDLLLRRPLHPVALRLVLLRALYAGEEKRREERVAIGADVLFRSGFWRRKALLADISQRGCRLLAEQPLSPGARINLPLPKELTPDALTLPCKVVRVATKPDAEGRLEIGLAFENLSKEKLAAVRTLMRQLSEAAGMEESRVLGGAKPRAAAAEPNGARPAATPAAAARPAAARPAAPRPGTRLAALRPAPPRAASPTSSAPGPRPTPPPSPPSGASSAAGTAARPAIPSTAAAERRQHPRSTFGREIPRLDDEANSVLLGRDLSIGGMRIEYHEKLQMGDLIELAIYVSPREEPIIAKARVAHDAGDGLGLAFEGLPGETAARLERLIAQLPSVESLQGGEAAGLGSVVSRVLSGFRRED